MRKSQTTSTDGYLQENRMESEENVEACSILRGETERRDSASHLMNKMISRKNLNAAYKAVKANKGSAGIDDMETGELFAYLATNKETLISQLKDGSYEPSPVKRVEVDKDDGSKRKLGDTHGCRPIYPTSYLTNHGAPYRSYILGIQFWISSGS